MVLPLRIGEVDAAGAAVAARRACRSAACWPACCSSASSTCSPSSSCSASRPAVVTVSDQVRQWGWMLSGPGAGGRGGDRPRSACRSSWRCGSRVRSPICLPEHVGEPAYGFARGLRQSARDARQPDRRTCAPSPGRSICGWRSRSVYVLRLLGLPSRRRAVARRPGADDAGGDRGVGAVGARASSARFSSAACSGCAIFGVAESPALAYSIIVHLTQFVGVIGAGLYSLWTENISLREVEAVEQRECPGGLKARRSSSA